MDIRYLYHMLEKLPAFVIDLYRQGLDGPLLDYMMKRCSGHKRIPDSILVEVQAVFDKSLK